MIKIKKEKLAKVINTRFPRIANYLKRQTKTKDITSNNVNVCITYILHKIYLNKKTDKDTAEYLLDYLTNNYLSSYIELVEDDITLSNIKELTNKLYSVYNTEESIFNLNEEELLNIVNEYNVTNIKESIIKVYNKIKLQYHLVEITK